MPIAGAGSHNHKQNCYLTAARYNLSDNRNMMCLNTRCKPRLRHSVIVPYCMSLLPGGIFASSRWEPNTSSASRLFCHIRAPV